MQRVLIGLAAVLLGGLSFAGGMRLTFPSQAASERVTYEVAQASDGAMVLQLEDINPWRLSGAKVSGLELFSVPKPRRSRSAEEPVPSRVLAMDDLAARVRILPLMAGVVDVRLQGELYGGSIQGGVVQDGSVTIVKDLLLDEVNLARYPFDFGEVSVDVGGSLRTRVTKLEYDTENLEDSQGKIRLEIEGLVLDGLEFSGIALPTSTFTEAILSFTLDNGKAFVKKGSFKADTLELEIEGQMELNKNLGRSRLALELKLRLLDEALDGLAKMAMGSSRDEQGFYHFDVTGSLDRPNAKPKRIGGSSRSTGRGTSSRGPGGKPAGPPPGDGPVHPPPPGMNNGNFDPSDRDPDKRRAEREERIRERREAMEERDRPGDEPEFEDEFDDEEDFEDEDNFVDEDFVDDELVPRPMPMRPEPPIVAPRGMLGEPRDWPDPVPPDED